MFIFSNVYHIPTKESLNGKESEVDDDTQIIGAEPTSFSMLFSLVSNRYAAKCESGH